MTKVQVYHFKLKAILVAITQVKVNAKLDLRHILSGFYLSASYGFKCTGHDMYRTLHQHIYSTYMYNFLPSKSVDALG